MAKVSFVLSAVILLLFFLVVSEIEAKICEKDSKTYSGKCEKKKCEEKCKSSEKSNHGACHLREGKESCFCYTECPRLVKNPGTKSPAPPKGGSPPGKESPPPADGGSPPPADGGSPPPADGGSPPPADGGSPPPPSAN